jgi:two-component system chemotaxis sensor kinase CheA
MNPMDAIKVTYFQECEELLADLERGLLDMEGGDTGSETINAVFRAVHSVKGGAGAFGFDALVSFAHVFETTLDEMRSGRLEVSPPAVAVMLRSADVLSDLLQSAKNGNTVDPARCEVLITELETLIGKKASLDLDSGPAIINEDGTDEWGFKPVTLDSDETAPRWHMTMTPTVAMYANGHDAAIFLRELSRLGSCDIGVDTSRLPALDDMDAEGAYLTWTLFIDASVEEEAIREVLDFVGDDCPMTITMEEPAPLPVIDAAEESAPLDVDALLNQIKESAPPPPETEETRVIKAQSAAAAAPAAANVNVNSPSANVTIRVDLERVDRMIDLVGELVINQAMLAQRVAESGLARSSNIAMGLDELEHLTREIQDSVMAIRAQPVKSVFQRMPRLVREIAASTGKQVKLVTEGENTEVDKTVIERLSEPITHMLRNAIDHGLETPEERTEAGKNPEGTVKLVALHRSGRIVIEVSDDGKGINRPRVREIAVNKGLIAADAVLSDDEIDNLIFLPGFSTAATVSNISGRGVGMDVVKRSIQSLGGRISISSIPGKGSTFSMSLPLTLAVLDGMVVTVGDQTLVAPLSTIVESLRPKPEDVRALGPKGHVLEVRGAHVPLIDIGVALGWRGKMIDPTNSVTLLVENEGGGRAALVADAILGQRQVVIKSLEANYQCVDGVAAATILGDGRVALILDVDAIVERRKSARPEPAPLAKAS